MTAKTSQNFSHWAGDTQTLEFTVEDSNGNSKDISSAKIVWSMFKTYSGSAKLKKTTDDNTEVRIVDGPNGRFDVFIKEGDTKNLEGIYLHQAELTDGLGDVITVSVGKALVYGTNQ